jgi:DNA-binding Lrp family transcriptional regulator
MDFDSLPAQLRPALNALAAALRAREPAIRERVEKLQAAVKFAREEANGVEIVEQEAGEKVFRYLFGS